MNIPASLRRLTIQRASDRCEYCKIAQVSPRLLEAQKAGLQVWIDRLNSQIAIAIADPSN